MKAKTVKTEKPVEDKKRYGVVISDETGMPETVEHRSMQKKARQETAPDTSIETDQAPA